MRIKKIKLTDFKGRNDTTELGARNIIAGMNFSGKTTILDALSIGLIGYHAQVGKTNKALAQFGSAEASGAEISFDDGSSASFSIYKEDGGATSMSRTPPNAPFADDPAVVAQFDPFFYFADTERKKVEMLFSQLGESSETLREGVLKSIDTAIRPLGDFQEDCPVQICLDDLREVAEVESEEDDFERLVNYIGERCKHFAHASKTLKDRKTAVGRDLLETGKTELSQEKREEMKLEAEVLEAEAVDMREDLKREVKALEVLNSWAEVFQGRPTMMTLIEQVGKESGSDPRVLDDKISENLERAKQLKEEASKSSELANKQNELEAVNEQHDKAVEVQKIWKTASDAVLKYKDARISEASDEMVSTMNAFCDGIMREPFCYEGGDIGYRIEDRFVSYKTFSGTERALVQMSLSVALASRSDFKLAVLDELGRFDTRNQRQIVKNVGLMIESGMLDQFIGVDVNHTAWEAGQLPDLTLIKTD